VKRLFVDANVVLDVLLDRQPHVVPAAALWAGIERRQSEGFLSAHALTTIFYLAQKAKGRAAATRMLHLILKVFRVGTVDESVIARALELTCPDFEDAVSAACAEAAGCSALVTRDPRGFKGTTIQVLDPREALAWLTTIGGHK
jgi:predicted nucleic acid-binding protein